MLRMTIQVNHCLRELKLAGMRGGAPVAETEKTFRAEGASKQIEVDLAAFVDGMRCPASADNEETKKGAMDTSENIKREAGDLYFFTFLLTGRPDLSIGIAADAVASEDGATSFFADWMRNWRRRLVIGKALSAVRGELSASARRTKRARLHASAKLQSTRPVVTNADLKRALLAIDCFPRAALLLLVFEGLRVADAATLLEVDARLLKKAQAIGLQQLTANLTSPNTDVVSSSIRAEANIIGFQG